MPAPQMSQSKNYVWFQSDTLGQGATGSVYYCRHRYTGELFAVKTFSTYSEMRPQDVKMREFEVLQKLDHPNIVRLVAIEEDLVKRRKVIIMELCDGGSLHTILEDPISAFGMEQTDFLTALEHITLGMQHLREQQVVHRDIKPGNILRQTCEDGSYVYKLTDFGAARELEDNDAPFMSIYGTEEYLHPDVYERGVLRQSTGKAFTAEIDLWSIGATLYHIATGRLPFRPHGGRRNKLTMHMLISQKEQGVISGVQHTENGPVDWSRELPETCLLSRSLRELVNPIIRGLLTRRPREGADGEQECGWSFERFFDETLKLVKRVQVYVFDVWNGRLTDVFLEPTDCLARLQEAIASCTDTSASDQVLLYKNQQLHLVVNELAQASTYPKTSRFSPIFLYRRSAQQPFGTLTLPAIPKFRTIEPGMAMDDVYLVTKESCGNIHYILTLVETSVLEQRLMNEAVEQYSHMITRHIERVRDHALHFRQTAEEAHARIQSLDAIHKANLAIIQKSGVQSATERELTDIIGDRSNQAAEFKARVEEVCQRAESHYNKCVMSRALVSRWSAEPYCNQTDSCVNRILRVEREVRDIWEEANTMRRAKRVPDERDVKFQMNKSRLKENATKAIKQIESHCYPNLNACHQRVAEWFGTVTKVEASVSQLESKLNSLADQQKEMSEAQTSIEMAYLARWQDWSPASGSRVASASSPGASVGTERGQNTQAFKKLRSELEEFEADHQRMVATATKNLEMLNYLESVAESMKMDS